MLAIQRKISSYNHYNYNNIQYIVLHYVGGTGSAKNNVDYFYNGDRGASAHYFVDDNSIWQSVEDSHGSWSVGDGNGRNGITNTNSINIEMCCQNDSNLTISNQTENNTIELVQYLMSKYGIDINHVVRHYDASGKVCPNWSYNNWSRWYNFKNKIANGNINKEEDIDMGTIVVYMNDIDKRGAEMIADRLCCPQIDGRRTPFDYSKYSEVICVGGEKGQFTCYCTKFIAGNNRYDTNQAVLNYINSL